MVTRQIMQQAGVAVLSQANAAPQSVLRLLG
jgi:flagellin-like hook-associated protein FlgL